MIGSIDETEQRGQPFHFIPFGRIRVDRDVSGNKTSVLVGRERQRAFLIDALTGTPRRGAYLVTGRRGVGKTTFVQNCLGEFKANVFRRHLRSSVGRSPLDLFLTLLLIVGWVVLSLTASDLIEFVAPLISSNVLLLVPLCAAIVITALPLLYGSFVISRLAISISRVWAIAIGTIFIIVVTWVSIFVIPFGAPAYSMMLCMVGLVVLVVVSPLFGGRSASLAPSLICTCTGDYMRRFACHLVLMVSVFFGPLIVTYVVVNGIHTYITQSLVNLYVHETNVVSNYVEKISPATALAELTKSVAVILPVLVLFCSSITAAVYFSSFVFEKTRSWRGNDATHLTKVQAKKACYKFVLTMLVSVLLIFTICTSELFATWVSADSKGSLIQHFEFEIFIYCVGGATIFGAWLAIYLVAPREFFLCDGVMLLSAYFTFLIFYFIDWNISSEIDLILLLLLFFSAAPLWNYFVENIISNLKKSSEVGIGHQDVKQSQKVSNSPKKYKGRRMVPPIEGMLFFKGLVFIAIGFQLCYPILEMGPKAFIPSTKPSQPDVNKNSVLIPVLSSTDEGDIKCASTRTEIRWPTTLNTKLLDSNFAANDGDGCESNYTNTFSADDRLPGEELLTPFGAERQDEGIWAVIVVLVFLMFYFVEHEWIGRSFIAQRQARSLDRGPRLSYLFHHDLDPSWIEENHVKENAQSKQTLKLYEKGRKFRFRAFEAATFPYAIARAWLPSLIVSVNLGFDKLDHRGVTHAMLFGLASEYKKQFLSWRSPYHVLSRLITFLFVMAAVSAASRAFVDVPYQKASISVEEIMVDWHLINGGTLKESSESYSKQRSGVSILYCPWLVHQQVISRSGQEVGTSALIPRLICEVAPEKAGTILSVLFSPILAINVDQALMPEKGDMVGDQADERPFRPIFSIFHDNNGLPFVVSSADKSDKNSTKDWELRQERSLTLRVYHALYFVFFYWLLAFVSSKFSVLPYQRIHRKIEALISALVLSRTERKKPGRFGLVRYFNAAFSNEGEAEISRDALDPRSVELALMEVLEEIQLQNRISIPIPLLSIALPTPEVHFVFDELDKIGGVVGSDETTLGIGEADKRAVDAERQRTYELHALLSDMKRVISSAPARFIFVGGRALHDEWVRDVNRMGTRQPLLSSIFDAEIYLPSLLLDLPRSVFSESELNWRSKRLDARVAQYLQLLHDAAMDLQNELQLTRLLPFYTSTLSTSNNRDFDESISQTHVNMKVIDGRRRQELGDEPSLKSHLDDKRWLLDDFTHFLAFRSAGSPKRLRETLLQFVRPSGSFFLPKDKSRFDLAPTRDMIVFDRAELYRIQFIAYVFRHIDSNFSEVLLHRDDKVAINVFFLFDYLMKLNARAFSLSSLERLDELAHIHRAPDLRRMLEKVIAESAEQFFHRMLNGLYSYRFQSDFAMEIRYLSRLSEPEMAALNFTLDESQELKTTYAAMLEASGEPNPDIISALGELYEFDQAYDVARGYYERAIRMIDEDLSRQVGSSVSSATPSISGVANLADAIASLASTEAFSGANATVDHIFSGSRSDRQLLNSYMPWAVRRLRLMMQIGLTFEQIGDEERAQAQYYSAHMLARAITDVAFDHEWDTEPKWLERPWLSLLIENFPLIYQPLLSSAWVSEKLEGSVDTSLNMIERELLDMSRHFDFIRNRDITSIHLSPSYFEKDLGVPINKSSQYGQNLALVSAEMHNKAGDIYFYKGRSPLSCGASLSSVLKLIKPEENDNHVKSIQRLKGYLPMARYHYCVALHEVRRFSNFRNQLAQTALNPIQGDHKAATHRAKSWASFTYLTAASSLIDLGELMRAGITVSLVLSNDDDDISDLLIDEKYTDELSEIFDDWSERNDRSINNLVSHKTEVVTLRQLHACYLGSWVEQLPQSAGRQKPSGASGIQNLKEVSDKRARIRDERRIKLNYEPSRRDAVFLSLHFGIMGAKQTRRGGLRLAAVHEYEIVLGHIGRLLKNILVLNRLSIVPGAELNFHMSNKQADLISLLSHTAVEVISRIRSLRGIKESKKVSVSESYLVGRDVPVQFAVTVLNIEGTLFELRSLMKSFPCFHSQVENNLGYISKRLAELFGDAEKQECYDLYFCNTDPSQFTRSRLLRMMDRHHFPVLAMMEARKTLIDLVMLGSLPQVSSVYKKRHLEAYRWLKELSQQAQLVDSPMHFTPTKLAETVSLVCLLSFKGEDHDIQNAFELLDDAEQSFSMGRKYYSNIGRLYYLYDDFNDRSRHAEHAASMMQADIIAIFRALLSSK